MCSHGHTKAFPHRNRRFLSAELPKHIQCHQQGSGDTELLSVLPGLHAQDRLGKDGRIKPKALEMLRLLFRGKPRIQEASG